MSFLAATSSVSAKAESIMPSCNCGLSIWRTTLPLLRWRPRFIQPNHSLQLRHLSMIPCIPHPMTPHHLAVLEHEFSTHLLDISALQRPATALHNLVYRLHDCAEKAGLDVVWLLAPE